VAVAVAVGAVVQAAAVVAVVSLLPQLASLLVVSRRANGVALAALALAPAAVVVAPPRSRSK